LRGRLALISIGVIAGWLGVLTIGFNVLLAGRLDRQALDIARARASAAAAGVRLDRTDRPLALESSGDAALDYGIWLYGERSAVQRPRASDPLQKVADSLAGRGVRTRVVGDDNRLYAVPIEQRGRQVATVVASVSLAPYESAEHTAEIGSALLSVLLLLGAYPVLRLTGRRALLPVEQMTHQAREWSAHAPSQRFGRGQGLSELDDLAATLDGVLDRLSAVLRHERQLSAELSHELRTPLSRIVAEADLLHRQDPTQNAYSAIRDSALDMNHIIETLLTTARAELQSEPAACDVSQVIGVLVRDQDACRLHARPGTFAGVDATVLTRLLTPVLDNLRRYARSAVDVGVDLAGDPERIRIVMSNDGPVIGDDDLEKIFDAGYTTSTSGAGLGLALARRLARAADGDVVAVSCGTGARFEVYLPPA
jgi:signal transduction histidine kinase